MGRDALLKIFQYDHHRFIWSNDFRNQYQSGNKRSQGFQHLCAFGIKSPDKGVRSTAPGVLERLL